MVRQVLYCEWAECDSLIMHFGWGRAFHTGPGGSRNPPEESGAAWRRNSHKKKAELQQTVGSCTKTHAAPTSAFKWLSSASSASASAWLSVLSWAPSSAIMPPPPPSSPPAAAATAVAPALTGCVVSAAMLDVMWMRTWSAVILTRAGRCTRSSISSRTSVPPVALW